MKVNAAMQKAILETPGVKVTAVARAPIDFYPDTEADFTREVLGLAKSYGWRSAHFRPGRTKEGWRTAVSGDGKGFPDVILVRRAGMVVAELKVGRNTCTPQQQDWLTAFREAGVRTFVWYPKDFDKIIRILQGD